MAAKRNKKPTPARSKKKPPVAQRKSPRRRPGPRPKWHIQPQGDTIDWDDESIKALREHMQLTQVQMAQELGTRQQTISEWEVGSYKPRGGMARLLTIVAERAKFKYRTGSDED